MKCRKDVYVTVLQYERCRVRTSFGPLQVQPFCFSEMWNLHEDFIMIACPGTFKMSGSLNGLFFRKCVFRMPGPIKMLLQYKFFLTLRMLYRKLSIYHRIRTNLNLQYISSYLNWTCYTLNVSFLSLESEEILAGAKEFCS